MKKTDRVSQITKRDLHRTSSYSKGQQSYKYEFGIIDNPNADTIARKKRPTAGEYTYLIDVFKELDNDSLSLTMDVEMLYLVFTHIFSIENRYRYVPVEYKNEINSVINQFYADEVCFNKKTLKNVLINGRSYIVLWKVLRSLGYTNDDINIYINSHIDVVDVLDFSYGEYTDLEKYIDILKYEKDIDGVVKKLFHYINTESVFASFSINNEVKKTLIDQTAIENINNLDIEMVKKYDNARNNMKAINVLAKANGIVNKEYRKNILNNLDVIFNTNIEDLKSYFSILMSNNMENSVLLNDLGVLSNFNTVEEAYAYITETLEMYNYSGNIPSVDGLRLIIENKNIDVLKEKHSLEKEEKEQIKKNYKHELSKRIDKYNEKVMIKKSM